MKIAFCSAGGDISSPVDERFGRASYFVFYDLEDSLVTSVENTAKQAKGGAGALAVQQIIDNNAEIIIAPEVGPQALEALSKFKIPAFSQGKAKTVEEALNAWKKNELIEITATGNKGLHRA